MVRDSRLPEEPTPKPLSAAAASDGSQPSIAVQAARGVDAASLVSAEEASSALGEAVKPAQPFALPYGAAVQMQGCHYAVASGGDAAVSVVSASGAIVKVLDRLYERPGAESMDVAGGRAYLHHDTVAVVCGDAVVLIRVHRGRADVTPALKQLASRASQRLSGSSVTAPS